MKRKKQRILLSAVLLTLSLIVIGCMGMAMDDYTPAAFTIEGDRAMMSGVIDGTTPEQVQTLIDEHPDVKTIVMQQVEGSADDEANLVAARLIRKHGFHTHVPADGEIASGGTDFFLAGATRSAEEGAKIGVHSWATGDGLTGDQVPKDDPQHKLYLDYYAEMGIPADFYWFTLQAAPAEEMHWMTTEEMAQYQMVTEAAVAQPAKAAQTGTMTENYYAVGNPESDVVIVNTQGGPVPFLVTDEFAELFGVVDFAKTYLVNVHQAQTLNPERFTQQAISFEEAKAFDTETVELMASVVQEFIDQGKQVYVVGISFGAFVVQDLLVTQGNVADGYLIQVGRLDMPEDVWIPFSEGRFVGFKDGVEVIDFAGAEEAGRGGEGEFTNPNMAKLAAGLGHKRYTELLADTDLSNVTYIYGQLDEQVGRLTDAEVAFLEGKDGTVISTAGGHGSEEIDNATNQLLLQFTDSAQTETPASGAAKDGESSSAGDPEKAASVAAFGDANHTHIGEGVLRQPVREAPDDIYTDSGIVATDEYGEYTKKMEVYGITFIAKEEMPDAFMGQVAQTMKEMFAQTEATDKPLQEAVLKNLYRYNAVLPIVTGEPEDLEAFLPTSSIVDIIMNNSDYQAMEVVEHILHTVTDIGLHYTLNDQFGLQKESALYKAMLEADASGFYDAAGYNDIPAGEIRDRIQVQEYAYWMITSAWNLQETYGLGEDEWTLKNAQQLQASQPAAYALFNEYITKIMSPPEETTLQAFGS